MKTIKILKFGTISSDLEALIEVFSQGIDVEIIEHDFLNHNYNNSKLLLVFEVNQVGINLELYNFLSSLDIHKNYFEKSVGALIVKSPNELYTKTIAQQVVFLLNHMGCEFIGQPLIELISDYKNYETWTKVYKRQSKVAIAQMQVKKLSQRLVDYKRMAIDQPKILVLHASSHETSNTLSLWQLINNNLDYDSIETYHVEDGNIIDCSGCSFETCLHYSKQQSCYYGGVIVEELLPAIEACDFIVWICPNYNDSISAKLMAVINRMTVLYRRISLKEKAFFGVIVSGNSGGDSLSKQLISALNFNKGFRLPPKFSIMEIANDPGKIYEVEGIEAKAKAFAENIKNYIESERR